MAELGSVKEYPVLMVLDPEVPRDDWVEIRTVLESAFKSVTPVKALINTSVDVGWPAGPNAMFRAAASAALMFPNEPWYFFEPDNTPMGPGWLDRLAEAYAKCGKPCMGVLQQSWRLLQPTNERIPAGKHLVGTAIYPTDLRALSLSFLGCVDPSNGRVIAFDVAMQGDLVDGQHAAHTNLIQHNWLTQNYRRDEDGVMVCDAREGRLTGQLGFSLPHPVNETIAVVHGCKDLTLLRLLRAERNAVAPTTPVLKAAVPTPAPTTPAVPKVPKRRFTPSNRKPQLTT